MRIAQSKTLGGLCFLLAVLAALWAGQGPADAHFLLNLNVRVLHVAHTPDGLRVYLRLPMPYLVADKLGPTGQDGLPAPAPFTHNRMEGERLVHIVDVEQLRGGLDGLGALVAQGHEIALGASPLEPVIEEVRLHKLGSEPDFASLESARGAISAPFDPEALRDTYVGDTVVDAQIFYPSPSPVRAYSLSSSLDPGLDGQENTANLILDHRAEGTEVYRVRGLMNEPVSIGAAPLSGFGTFLVEGVRHILEGPDHLLFVICLILGASGLWPLVSRATGFTVGHSITLIAGFWGLVPKAAWFIPLVETGIALSIVYAAVLALRRGQLDKRSEWSIVAITSALGLLHGLGFSFMLREILRVDAPNIWESLLAFNLGVEVGQVIVILIGWPALWLLHRASPRAWKVSTFALASLCIAVASFWTLERSALLFQMFS